MVRKIGIIAQAHIGSSRLPNKMLKDLCGKTVLGHVISRLKLVRYADALIIATSDLPEDDVIVKECQKYRTDVFRGSNEDVLSRFYHAAVAFELTDIARVCADNTLIDWDVMRLQRIGRGSMHSLIRARISHWGLAAKFFLLTC